ncbi:hypothetical protein [Rhodopseudomonas sp. RCAM05734]|uniref:hypothetical protein n=1 Tax=Rhodopseudomonas sp. RCAM05734 TaxID=3457549 RepID=UPI004043FD17
MATIRRTRRLPGISTIRPTVTISPIIDSSLVAPRAAMSDAAATRRMAEDMREAVYREGGLTEEGLELLGYSADQIGALVRPARAMANRLAALA